MSRVSMTSRRSKHTNRSITAIPRLVSLGVANVRENVGHVVEGNTKHARHAIVEVVFHFF